MKNKNVCFPHYKELYSVKRINLITINGALLRELGLLYNQPFTRTCMEYIMEDH